MPQSPASISARTAAVLAREPFLRRLRVRYRPTDPEIYADLLTITVIGYACEVVTGNVTPNVTGIVIGSSGPDDRFMTPAEVAQLAGVSAAAVRRAVREGRLDARRPAGRWQIPAAAAARYAREFHG